MNVSSDNRQLVEQLNARALAFVRSGQNESAVDLWKQALILDPWQGVILSNLIRLLFKSGRFSEGFDIVDALPEHVISAQMAMLVGQASLSQRTFQKAEQYFQIASQLRPGDPSIELSLAESYLGSGKINPAIVLLESLCRTHPSEPAPLLRLAVAYSESGSYDKADQAFQLLRSRLPRDSAIQYNAALFYFQLGQLNLTQNCLDALFAVDPKSRSGRILLADLLRAKGLLSDSIELQGTLLHEDPSDFSLRLPLIYAAMEDKNWGLAEDHCQQAFLQLLDSPSTRLWSAVYDLPANSQVSFGGPAHFDPVNIVERYEIFKSGDPLHLKLLNWVRRHPSLLADRPGKPTRGGLQTHELFDSSDGCSQDLTNLLLPYIDQYLHTHRNHPTFSSLDRSLLQRLSGWAVLLRSSGHQIRHTHPESVVSGVLYLQIPEDMSNADNSNGSLAFTSNPLFSEAAVFSPFSVVPAEGTLLLFPSFVPHETIPFVSSTDRICIAFNYGC